MFAQSRWSAWSVPCLLAGFVWIESATSVSALAALPLWSVGALLLGSGVSQLFWPGDRRATQLGALGGLLGAVLSLPYFLGLGLGSGLLLLSMALAAAWGSGRMALVLEPHYTDVPTPRPSARLAAKVAGDEAILGFELFQSSTGFALDGAIERIIEELDETHDRFTQQGLIEKPEAYHETPPDLEDPEIRRERIGEHPVEILRFESGYAPAEGEPGRARWLGYEPCRDGWAYVLRHEGPPRPWLIATNGYRMGFARMDVGLFERFHRDCDKGGLGLNVAIPVLPLHGPRRLGWHSGTGFLGFDVIDTLHAESQGIWDMRRLLSWVRGQGDQPVGAFGLSLGGYTTALFASVADGLSAAIPGIPVADWRRVLERHAAPHQLAYARSLGFDLDRLSDVFRVISPLALEPRVPHAGRMLFGATADRLVAPDHVRDLWRHWDEPEIVWYEGTHVTFMNERDVWSGVDRTLRESGVAAANG